MKLFSKRLTCTDKDKRLSIPTGILASLLPASHDNERHDFELHVRHKTTGWRIVCSTRKKGHKKPVLSKGWRRFSVETHLDVGDIVTLYKEGDGADGSVHCRIEVEKASSASVVGITGGAAGVPTIFTGKKGKRGRFQEKTTPAIQKFDYSPTTSGLTAAASNDIDGASSKAVERSSSINQHSGTAMSNNEDIHGGYPTTAEKLHPNKFFNLFGVDALAGNISEPVRSSSRHNHQLFAGMDQLDHRFIPDVNLDLTLAPPTAK